MLSTISDYILAHLSLDILQIYDNKNIYSSRDIILFLSNITKVIYIRSHVCNSSIFEFSQQEVGGGDGAKNKKSKKKNVFSLHVQLIKDLFR